MILLLTLGVKPAVAKESQARITLFLVPAKGYKNQLVAKVQKKLISALRTNPHLVVEDSDKLLVQFSGEVPRDEISRANHLLSQGMEQLQSGVFNEAVSSLQEAVGVYETILPFIKKQTLSNAFFTLGYALAEARNRRKAFEIFVQLLIWRFSYKYNLTKYNARHLPLFERARAVVKKLRRGSIEIITDPPGARAYIDGRFMGVTPTVVFGLKVGAHYATFKKMGFVKAGQKVTVSPVAQQQVTVQLKRSEKFLLLKQSLENAKLGLGREEANSAMVDLRSFLFIDQVIFTTMGYEGPDRMKIQAYLYDLRSKLRLNQVTMTVNTRSLGGLEQLMRLLYQDVRLDGTATPPPEPPPPPPPKRKPFYTSWWFWTSVGAGLATAIIVPYLAWPETREAPSGYIPVSIKN